MFSVDAVDPDHAWAVGQQILMATSDGGRSWQPVGEPDQGMLRVVDFIDAQMQASAVHDNSLLGYLSFYSSQSNQPRPRETIIGMFWPDAEPDVVLLDLALQSDDDGLAVSEQLAARVPESATIMISHHDDVGTRRRAAAMHRSS